MRKNVWSLLKEIFSESIGLTRTGTNSWKLEPQPGKTDFPGIRANVQKGGTSGGTKIVPYSNNVKTRTGSRASGIQGLDVQDKFPPKDLEKGRAPEHASPKDIAKVLKLGPGKHDIESKVKDQDGKVVKGPDGKALKVTNTYEVTQEALNQFVKDIVPTIVDGIEESIRRFPISVPREKLLVTTIGSGAPLSDTLGKSVAAALKVKFVPRGFIKTQNPAQVDVDLDAAEKYINGAKDDQEKATREAAIDHVINTELPKWQRDIAAGTFTIHNSVGRHGYREFLKGIYTTSPSLIEVDAGPAAEKYPFLIIIDDNIDRGDTVRLVIEEAESRGFVVVAHAEAYKLN